MEYGWHRIFVVGVLLLLLLGAAGKVAYSVADPVRNNLRPFNTRDIFLERCSRCHEPEKAYGAIGNKPAWSRTVASMAIRDRSWIPPDDVRMILDYQDYYRTHTRLIFQQHCGGCHAPGEIARGGRSESQWRTIITYMANRRGSGITSEERELLVVGLPP